MFKFFKKKTSPKKVDAPKEEVSHEEKKDDGRVKLNLTETRPVVLSADETAKKQSEKEKKVEEPTPEKKEGNTVGFDFSSSKRVDFEQMKRDREKFLASLKEDDDLFNTPTKQRVRIGSIGEVTPADSNPLLEKMERESSERIEGYKRRMAEGSTSKTKSGYQTRRDRIPSFMRQENDLQRKAIFKKEFDDEDFDDEALLHKNFDENKNEERANEVDFNGEKVDINKLPPKLKRLLLSGILDKKTWD